ncbi:hypothetical protein L7F22_046027 [Adiantum nelumboides]|nr:hypothetical protein [Adiantum nelumboides]
MLTQKGVPFSWGVTEVTVFQQTLKEKMTTGPVLILPDVQKSFEVYCDACGRSLGAVLMQEGRVIACESRMFSKPQMTAQIYERAIGEAAFGEANAVGEHLVIVSLPDCPCAGTEECGGRCFVSETVGSGYFRDSSQYLRGYDRSIFRLHGMPETIVSDRDPRFTSLFWKAIWENIDTRLQFSSSFHPQTDGQSEIANSVVLDLLKSYISNQKTQWERYLPLVEFAYNNTIHSSTGKAPFEIVEGAMKVPPFLSTKDKIFEADEYTRDLDTAFAKVRETLQKSQERQKKAADRNRRDLKLKENDWITERINDVSFQLRLSDTWKIHNAFHVSLLKPFRGDVSDDGEPNEQPEVEENEEILVPEQILAHKDTKTKGKVRRKFLVKFKNYPTLDAKWMEEEDLADTPQIVKLYLEAFGLA